MNRARNNRNIFGVTDNGGTWNGTNNMQNGTNGMQNGTNGMQNGMGNNGMNGGGGGALTGDLLEQIRALSFVKVELELYLDTHPRCRTALDYYYQTIEALKRLTEEYENNYGPLTAAGTVSQEHWTWTDTPWPWHNGSEIQPRRERDR